MPKFILDKEIIIKTPKFPEDEIILKTIKDTNLHFTITIDDYGTLIVTANSKPRNNLSYGIVWNEI